MTTVRKRLIGVFAAMLLVAGAWWGPRPLPKRRCATVPLSAPAARSSESGLSSRVTLAGPPGAGPATVAPTGTTTSTATTTSSTLAAAVRRSTGQALIRALGSTTAGLVATSSVMSVAGSAR